MQRNVVALLGLLVLVALPSAAHAKDVVSHDVAESPSEVRAYWTAERCVNEGPGAFVTQWQFVPGYIDGATPYGTYPATRLHTTTAWKNSGDFSYDLGAATVSGDLFSAVGGRNVAALSSDPLGMHVISYGYPAAGKFNGQRQYYCNSNVTYRDSGNPQTMGIPCNMTGGSSGGGWI